MYTKNQIIFIGIITGMIWYRFGERFDQTKLEPKCWEKLHYYNKEKFPLYLVHLKSILAGLVLIILPTSKYLYKNEIIMFIGAAIIGLHIFQFKNEYKLIQTFGKEFYLKTN